MRANQTIAKLFGVSRRVADKALSEGLIKLGDQTLDNTSVISLTDKPVWPGQELLKQDVDQLVMLHKPKGYVSSKDGQGSPTIYELLPAELQHYAIAGRLDKDSSGLILLTNNGDLANKLMHPSNKLTKVYQVRINKDFAEADKHKLNSGVHIDDTGRTSNLKIIKGENKHWSLALQEGRNRQIRKTFIALGYEVVSLHRTEHGPYKLDDIKKAEYELVVL